MFQLHRLQASLLAVFALALVAPSASVAQDSTDRDTREISAYVLTESGLAKYSQAARNMAALPDRCDEEEGDGAKSLDEAVARMDAIPEVRAAIKFAGMTTREYMVFSFSLFQNGMTAWALSQPGGKLPAGASMANVDFYRAHEAAFQKLQKETRSGDCDDSGDEEE